MKNLIEKLKMFLYKNTNLNNTNGITLIALVITIIVLLILAGVTISTLMGDNGILTKANEAKIETENSQNTEIEKLNNIEDEITNITGVNWEEAFKTATKHPDQQYSTAIGLGTNGKVVNMDLWEFTLLEDDTYGLNTLENLNTDVSSGVTSGYKGKFTETGQIEGTIPQYISEDNGKTYKEVTDLKWLFFNCTEMKVAPKIPSTVKKINYTFRDCTSLINTPLIPNNVEEMDRSFQGCINLENITNLPNNVVNLSYTFNDCKKLTTIPYIPSKVENMHCTFLNCTNINTVNIVIPESVTNMQRTFYRCENLSGTIEINANLNGTIINDETDYVAMFNYAAINTDCKIILSGTCNMLNNIISQAGNPNIILKESN